MKKRIFWGAGLLLVGIGLFAGGYFLSRSQAEPASIKQATKQGKNYYISFDDYYYEVPKQKAVDDKLVAGGQFIYNVNSAIKINTLDDLFSGGAVGVQSLVPLYGDDQSFATYLNTIAKPAALNAFQGTADLLFGRRDRDKVKTAELVSKKDGQVARRQFMVNLPQAVAVVAKDDSEAYRSIGRTVGQASAKFADYEDMKLQVLTDSYMLSNRMFTDMYRLAHEDFKNATSVDEMNRLADKSKDALKLEAKVSGVQLNNGEMTATILFVDPANPGHDKTGSFTFRQVAGAWKLFALKLPGGVISGSS